MIENMKRAEWYPWIVLAVSAVTHFLFYGYPAQVVFDEVHFGSYISSYFTHAYFFDIHPPFAKLLIALATWLGGGYMAGFSFATIGMPYPDAGYLVMRFLPTLAGTLLPFVAYFIARELDCDEGVSLLTGLLFALASALVVISRFILTDSILILTGFLSIYFFLRYWNRGGNGRGWSDLFLAGVFAGCAISTKWVGLAYLGITGLFFLGKWFFGRPDGDQKTKKRSLKELGFGAVVLIVVPAAIYVSLFAVHFALLYKSGPGDAYQTPAFQRTLEGSTVAASTSTAPLNFWQKFIEVNHTMYAADQENLVDPYASKWFEWPFMVKPILYWTESFPSGAEGVIYFVGNPVLWALGFIAVIAVLIGAVRMLFKKGFRRFARSKITFVAVGFLASYLPLILIGRILFLYHYLPALIFSFFALALCMQWLRSRFSAERFKRLWITLLAFTVAAFLVVAPFTYGTPVPWSYLHFFAPFLHDTW